ncbi:MAG: methylmalonyl-CoA mutase, partial [Bdellovibrio sp.]
MYKPSHPIRIVTAASLFDGHDASINIIRRLLQDAGAEVIHLGHNRSVWEVVKAALQEGVQGIAISSYQGGHMEYFKYTRDLLNAFGASYVKIFGGGGGVIQYDEKRELEAYGISRIFHPDDGRRLGLEGMIEEIMKECDFDLLDAAQGSSETSPQNADLISEEQRTLPHRELGLAIHAIENQKEFSFPSEVRSFLQNTEPLVLGVTGTGGAGKSSLVDELLTRFFYFFPHFKIGVVSVDPSKKKTGGALLGDRIRMNALDQSGAFMRSMASRGSGKEIAKALPDVLGFLKKGAFDLLIAESSGTVS